MRYHRISLWLLAFSFVVLLGPIWVYDARTLGSNISLIVGCLGVLATVALWFKERKVVRDFEEIFGFLPPVWSDDEPYVHLVSAVVTRCASGLQGAYKALDAAREARSRASGADQIEDLEWLYQVQRRCVVISRRDFDRAVKTANSWLLPRPYDFRTAFKDWKPQDAPEPEHA